MMASYWIQLVCVVSLLGQALCRQNSCAIYSGGCAFHVVLAGKNCLRDTPRSSAYTQLMQGDDPKAAFYDRYEANENSINKEQLELEKMVHAELESNNKRLTELEGKLTRMMEGLSVRSLRHFRKIKSDMGAIMSSVRSISKDGGRARDDGRCPDGFIASGSWNSCYSFSTVNASWEDASALCGQLDANLVAIESEREAYVLDGLIRKNQELQTPKGWWTAGNYNPRSRQWVWSKGRHSRAMERTGYARWAPNEPNARSIMHCMLMYKEADYQWHDGTCTDHHNFICEIKIDG